MVDTRLTELEAGETPLDYKVGYEHGKQAAEAQVERLNRVAELARLVFSYSQSGGTNWWGSHDRLYAALDELDALVALDGDGNKEQGKSEEGVSGKAASVAEVSE